MIDENELIKSLEDLTNEYRDKQANAKNEKHNAFLTGALGILIDVTNMVRHWPKRRNRMTNLEHYKREISDRWMGYVKHRGQERYNEYLGLAIIDVYIKDLKRLGLDEPATAVASVMHWLVREYEEPIKLKQWEKDLLGYLYRTSSEKMSFVYYAELNYLKGEGHFKGITNADMELSEILNNCEVIDK